MSKYKFILKRKPSFEANYCVIRDLVYGDNFSSMKVGEICYPNEAPAWAVGKRFLASVAWSGQKYTAFYDEKEARAFLEQRFTETFLGGRDKSTEAGEVGSTDA